MPFPRSMADPSPGEGRRSLALTVALCLCAALTLLVLAAPAPASPPRVSDASYLADGPGGLRLALVVHDGRLEAYACDGTARRAFFAARARRGRHMLRNRDGARLALRLGARTARSTLTLKDAAPLSLTARRVRVAIFTVSVRPDGALSGTARDRGVLGAHLSQAGLVGAVGFGGFEPRAFTEPGFAKAPLFVDGRPVLYPPERAAEALQGEWRWIVTPGRVVGATTNVIAVDEQGIGLAIPAQLLSVNSVRFIRQDVGF